MPSEGISSRGLRVVGGLEGPQEVIFDVSAWLAVFWAWFEAMESLKWSLLVKMAVKLAVLIAS